MKLISNHFIFDYFFKFDKADEIKKFVKRDVAGIEGEIDSSDENYSEESSEEETTDEILNSTTESGSSASLNLDPFQTPKEEEEISTEEQTKSLDELESPTEHETFSTTSSSTTEESFDNDESTTVSVVDESLEGENLNVPEVTELVDEVLNLNNLR